MVKQYIFTVKSDCEHLLGSFLDESNYDSLITEAADVHYVPFGSEANDMNCVLKYRPNFFSQEEMDGAYSGLREAAVESQNRGLAAGPRGDYLGNRKYVTPYEYDIIEALCISSEAIDGTDPVDEIRKKYSSGFKPDDTRGSVWLVNKTPNGAEFNFDEWVDSVRNLPPNERIPLVEKFASDCISTTTYANPVNSGIAGSFGRYPRIPFGRLTSYTENNFEVYKKCFPFMKRLAIAFSELLPERYGCQIEFTNKIDSKFVVPETPFTTITVNKTFRTAAHRDAGDLKNGFSNLCVLSNGKEYTGGHLILPEFRAAVAVKPGDLLLIANHDWIHGNTPIELVDPEAERISLVCYAREDMGELGSFEYETLRRNFVDERRKNKNHILWRPLWNGVSPLMWDGQEWYDYVREHGGVEMLSKYHPDSVESVSIESFI